MQQKKVINIEIKGSAINKASIEDCLREYKDIKQEQNPILHFFAKQEITMVDISFIGHLIMIKNEIPNIEIWIELRNEKNILTGSVDSIDTENIVGRLGLYAAHALHTLGKLVFSIKYKYGIIDEDELKNNIKWLALSSKYMPIVFINKVNKRSIFDTQLGLIKFESILREIRVTRGAGTKDNDLYQAIRRTMSVKLNPYNYIEVLASISYYRALVDAKLLCFSLYESLNEDIKKTLNINKKQDVFVGNLKYVESENNSKIKIDLYYEKIKPLFNELSSKPIIYHLVFSTLISSNVYSSAIKDSSISDITIKLLKLWEFTKELVYGLNELAKNIIQHTKRKVGVITGYINNDNEFELNIFDYGKEGILKTFISSLKDRKSKDELFEEHIKLIEEDIKQIEDGFFTFNSFFSGKEILNEQSNRATAHLGILFLTRLIIHNEGSLVACSFNSEINDYNSYCSNDNINITPTIGTSYLVKLPLKENIKYEPYKKLVIPQVLKDSIDVENAFFNYRFSKNITESSIDLDNSNKYKTLYNISLYNIPVKEISENSSFDKLLWDQIESQEENIKKKLIICIDFDETKDINGSELFRFLGKWELNFPNVQLIIFNINIGLLFDLKK